MLAGIWPVVQVGFCNLLELLFRVYVAFFYSQRSGGDRGGKRIFSRCLVRVYAGGKLHVTVVSGFWTRTRSMGKKSDSR